ncbi:invasion associated locus B family protein [Microvirga sp. W0021]|uniref:Invasion associated locus B family protein n=1 Tax=Hohaiivirga grylli TaxID=3133970 RepID=A0ABV0BLC0_9HYPH
MLLLAGSAAAQQPEAAENRFDDWELSCNPQPATQQSGCRISQQLAIQESGKTVFAVTILPGEKKNELVGVVSIPLGGYIAPGIELRIDNKNAYKILVETCNTSGCHAGFTVSPKLQRELMAGKKAQFRIWTTKAQPTDVTVSLTGIKKAIEALHKRGAQ